MPNPDIHADLIYLCSPNNPTGAVYTLDQLKAWVAYALEHKAVILFDAAYEAELCDRAAALLGESDRAGALQVLSEQRAFFEEHIASWFDDFRNRASSMVTTRFYQGILKVTAAFFADEPVLMDDLEKCLSWRRYQEQRENRGI